MEVYGNYQSSLSELAAAIGHIHDGEQWVYGIQTELMKIEQGDIWCYPRPNVEQCQLALARGCVAIVCCAAVETTLPLFEVTDFEHSLGLLLNLFYQEPTSHMQVMAVTGTNGKTTVAYLCAAAMRILEKNALLIGTLGRGSLGHLQAQRHTTPPAGELHQALATGRDRGAEYVAMEASSHGLDQGRLAGVMVDVAVFTNLTHEHMDYHKTINEYLAAKQKLFMMKTVGISVINLDDPSGEIIASRIRKAKWACSLKSIPRGYDRWSYGSFEQSSLQGGILRITTHDAHCTIPTSLIGSFNAENLLLAHAALCVWGIDPSEAAKALSKVDTIPGRLQRVEYKELLCEVFIDYSHTPAALERVLSELDELKTGTLWVVFGAGGERDLAKRPMMGAVAERYADQVVLTEDNSRAEDKMDIMKHIQSGMKSPHLAHVIPQRQDAIRYALREARESDIVVIAGMGHETTMETNEGSKAYSDIATVEEILTE